jgi:hypothetical protein
MVKIVIIDYLDSFVTNDDGNKLFKVIKKHFDNNEFVEISFQGIKGLNSSFINSAFINLLDYYDFDYIKRHLSFKNSTKQINALILSRFKFETQSKITVS